MKKREGRYRREVDTLGELQVPAEAYYGIQTQRGAENFPISGAPPKEVFIDATVMVKRSAAVVNTALGTLKKRKGRAIVKAADRVLSKKDNLKGHFIIDTYQAGAGTSHNMNCNEVLANLAIESLGGERGDYSIVHPNDDVNMSQSTNDTFPTASRIAAISSGKALITSVKSLERELKRKARSFKGVLKSARTHLQDAVPITLGQDFASYASAVAKCRLRVESALSGLAALPIGATAAGTGINAPKGYKEGMIRELRKITGISTLKGAEDPLEGLNSMSDMVALSASLRGLAIEVGRIASDLRLLSSGPKTGLGEITLPPVQPGSSIMPGKVNPVMAEMMNMVCYSVIGHDSAVGAAASGGQLELNVMGPVVNHSILESIEILTNGINQFTRRAVTGIKANRERCREYFEGTVGFATVLNPLIGYANSAAIARESAASGRSIKEILIDGGVLTEGEWEDYFGSSSITGVTGQGKG